MEENKDLVQYFIADATKKFEILNNKTPLQYLTDFSNYLEQYNFPFVDENQIEQKKGENEPNTIIGDFSIKSKEFNYQVNEFLSLISNQYNLEITENDLSVIYDYFISTLINGKTELADFERGYKWAEHKESFLLLKLEKFETLKQNWEIDFNANFSSDKFWTDHILSGKFYWHKYYFIGFFSELRKEQIPVTLKIDILEHYFIQLGKSYAGVYSKLLNYKNEIEKENIFKLKAEIESIDIKGKTKERLLLAYKLGFIKDLKNKIDPTSTTFASAKMNRLVSFLFNISEDSAKKYNTFFGNPKKENTLKDDPRKIEIYNSLADMMEKIGFSNFEDLFKFDPNE